MDFEEYKAYVIATITAERELLAEEGHFGLRRLDLLVQLRKAEAATTSDELFAIMDRIHD